MTPESRPEENALRAVQLDHRQIRVLAHPLRIRLLGTLRTDGPATATSLAEKLRTNTGATSYHLRQLADVGLVVEEPDRGTARQRWWRAAHDISNWDPTDYDDDPDARAAVEWIQTEQVRQLAELADDWFAVRNGYPPAWRDAAGMSDVMLTVGPDRLRALSDELWQVVERHRQESVPDEPDARPVHLLFAAFPKVEPGR
ncbi:MAG TPA: helix-turn-helix domain-containing protein [Micromonospora sp.]